MTQELDLSEVYKTATPAGRALIDLNCQVLNGGFSQWFDHCEPTAETFELLGFGLGRIPDTVLGSPTIPRGGKLAAEIVARGQLVRGVAALVKLAASALARKPDLRDRYGDIDEEAYDAWERTIEPLDDLYYALDDDALMALVAKHLTEEPTDEPCCHCEGTGKDVSITRKDVSLTDLFHFRCREHVSRDSGYVVLPGKAQQYDCLGCKGSGRMPLGYRESRELVVNHLGSRKGSDIKPLSSGRQWQLYCMADGFGKMTSEQLRGINGGWDWSHIRDSSPEAILAMAAQIREWAS